MKNKINILLTRFPGNASKIICFFKRSFYTHVSIGLDEDFNTFYSFVWKGFRVEKITRYVKPDQDPYPCRLYEMDVSENTYDTIKNILYDFESNQTLYHYAKWSVVFGMLRIPLKQKNRYFCSQFVAEVLERSRAIQLKKNSNFYFPCDFGKLTELSLIFQGNLRDYVNHYGLSAAAI